MTTKELESKYNIGIQTITKWVKKGLLPIQKDWKPGKKI